MYRTFEVIYSFFVSCIANSYPHSMDILCDMLPEDIKDALILATEDSVSIVSLVYCFFSVLLVVVYLRIKNQCN